MMYTTPKRGRTRTRRISEKSTPGNGGVFVHDSLSCLSYEDFLSLHAKIRKAGQVSSKEFVKLWFSIKSDEILSEIPVDVAFSSSVISPSKMRLRRKVNKRIKLLSLLFSQVDETNRGYITCKEFSDYFIESSLQKQALDDEAIFKAFYDRKREGKQQNVSFVDIFSGSSMTEFEKMNPFSVDNVIISPNETHPRFSKFFDELNFVGGFGKTLDLYDSRGNFVTNLEKGLEDYPEEVFYDAVYCNIGKRRKDCFMLASSSDSTICAFSNECEYLYEMKIPSPQLCLQKLQGNDKIVVSSGGMDGKMRFFSFDWEKMPLSERIKEVIDRQKSDNTPSSSSSFNHTYRFSSLSEEPILFEHSNEISVFDDDPSRCFVYRIENISPQTVIASSNMVRLMDIQKQKLVRQFEGHRMDIHSLRYSSHYKYFLSSGCERYAYIHSPLNKSFLHRFELKMPLIGSHVIESNPFCILGTKETIDVWDLRKYKRPLQRIKKNEKNTGFKSFCCSPRRTDLYAFGEKDLTVFPFATSDTNERRRTKISFSSSRKKSRRNPKVVKVLYHRKLSLLIVVTEENVIYELNCFTGTFLRKIMVSETGITTSVSSTSHLVMDRIIDCCFSKGGSSVNILCLKKSSKLFIMSLLTSRCLREIDIRKQYFPNIRILQVQSIERIDVRAESRRRSNQQKEQKERFLVICEKRFVLIEIDHGNIKNCACFLQSYKVPKSIERSWIRSTFGHSPSFGAEYLYSVHDNGSIIQSTSIRSGKKLNFYDLNKRRSLESTSDRKYLPGNMSAISTISSSYLESTLVSFKSVGYHPGSNCFLILRSDDSLDIVTIHLKKLCSVRISYHSSVLSSSISTKLSNSPILLTPPSGFSVNTKNRIIGMKHDNYVGISGCSHNRICLFSKDMLHILDISKILKSIKSDLLKSTILGQNNVILLSNIINPKEEKEELREYVFGVEPKFNDEEYTKRVHLIEVSIPLLKSKKKRVVSAYDLTEKKRVTLIKIRETDTFFLHFFDRKSSGSSDRKRNAIFVEPKFVMNDCEVCDEFRLKTIWVVEFFTIDLVEYFLRNRTFISEDLKLLVFQIVTTVIRILKKNNLSFKGESEDDDQFPFLRLFKRVDTSWKFLPIYLKKNKKEEVEESEYVGYVYNLIKFLLCNGLNNGNNSFSEEKTSREISVDRIKFLPDLKPGIFPSNNFTHYSLRVLKYIRMREGKSLKVENVIKKWNEEFQMTREKLLAIRYHDQREKMKEKKKERVDFDLSNIQRGVSFFKPLEVVMDLRKEEKKYRAKNICMSTMEGKVEKQDFLDDSSEEGSQIVSVYPVFDPELVIVSTRRKVLGGILNIYKENGRCVGVCGIDGSEMSAEWNWPRPKDGGNIVEDVSSAFGGPIRAVVKSCMKFRKMKRMLDENKGIDSPTLMMKKASFGDFMKRKKVVKRGRVRSIV